MNDMTIDRRNDFPRLLRHMGLTGFAAEIGVAEGGFSFHLLDHWPGTCYQIDPWLWQPTPGYSGHGTLDQEQRFQDILLKSGRYQQRSKPLRMTSIEGSKLFQGSYFDFVYIDAIHTYECASEDIALWYPKVRSGGILAGHDFLDGVYQGEQYGVMRAVTEFAIANQLTVNVVPEEWPSWWVVKP